ncbi:hypothetical protein C8F01DRAFT_1374536 [Mycena amicta]|nr:hypothetical protein C8F01DRAFT_1374536 [Mycena amicta]
MSRRLSVPLQRPNPADTTRRASLPSRLADKKPPFVVPFHYSPPTSTRKPAIRAYPKAALAKQKPLPLSPSPSPKATKVVVRPRQEKPGPFPTRIPSYAAQTITNEGIPRIRYTPVSLRIFESESLASFTFPTPSSASPSPPARVIPRVLVSATHDAQIVSATSEEPSTTKDANDSVLATSTSSFGAPLKGQVCIELAEYSTQDAIPQHPDTHIDYDAPTELPRQLTRRRLDVIAGKTSSPQRRCVPLAPLLNIDDARRHSNNEKPVKSAPSPLRVSQQDERETASPLKMVDSIFGPRRVRKVIVPPISEGSVPSRDPKIVTEIASLRAQKKVGQGKGKDNS